jgi:hypothetical protein
MGVKAARRRGWRRAARGLRSSPFTMSKTGMGTGWKIRRFTRQCPFCRRWLTFRSTETPSSAGRFKRSNRAEVVIRLLTRDNFRGHGRRPNPAQGV